MDNKVAFFEKVETLSQLIGQELEKFVNNDYDAFVNNIISTLNKENIEFPEITVLINQLKTNLDTSNFSLNERDSTDEDYTKTYNQLVILLLHLFIIVNKFRNDYNKNSYYDGILNPIYDEMVSIWDKSVYNMESKKKSNKETDYLNFFI